MRQRVRFGLAFTLVAGVTPMTLAQAPPAPKGTTQPATKTARPPKADEVLATVNGDKITRADVVSYLRQFAGTPGDEQLKYDVAVNTLINTKLLAQFLKAQKVDVSKADVDKVISEQEDVARKNNTSLAAALSDSNTSIDDLRDRITQTLQWKNYLKARANDPELKKYAETNKDIFNESRVRASHIQLNLPPNATAADKDKAKQKLVAIRKEIETGKISFADAANKFSEADTNVTQPSGGDVDWFPRRGLTEAFAAEAFRLKKGEISPEPIETEYGMHLIQVTDRREGGAIDFERYRDRIMNQFAFDLQNSTVGELRKDPKTKIDIKPLPADLFPKAPAATTTTTAPAAKEEKAK